LPALLTWIMVDTNPSHVEAWRRAFKRFVFDIPAAESELLQAGACAVWRDTGHLYADLDRALEIASLAAAASE
jgi:beta-phosphoglucomutase-like phosphatase (HAD superfamily)